MQGLKTNRMVPLHSLSEEKFGEAIEILRERLGERFNVSSEGDKIKISWEPATGRFAKMQRIVDSLHLETNLFFAAIERHI